MAYCQRYQHLVRIFGTKIKCWFKEIRDKRSRSLYLNTHFIEYEL